MIKIRHAIYVLYDSFTIDIMQSADVAILMLCWPIRKSPPQFENRIMARVYVWRITRSTMLLCTNVPKSSILLAGTGVWKISSVACGFSSI